MSMCVGTCYVCGADLGLSNNITCQKDACKREMAERLKKRKRDGRYQRQIQDATEQIQAVKLRGDSFK